MINTLFIPNKEGKEILFIASDHAGFELKRDIIKALNDQYQFVDLGCWNNTKSCDYPYFANKTVRLFINFKESKNSHKFSYFGILICGSGVGMSIVANRNRFIRAALCYDIKSTTLARQHNDANFLCIGGRIITITEAIAMINTFTSVKHLGGRHGRRVKKINSRFYSRTFFRRIYDLIIHPVLMIKRYMKYIHNNEK